MEMKLNYFICFLNKTCTCDMQIVDLYILADEH